VATAAAAAAAVAAAGREGLMLLLLLLLLSAHLQHVWNDCPSQCHQGSRTQTLNIRPEQQSKRVHVASVTQTTKLAVETRSALL
jgi:hypothetical protein